MRAQRIKIEVISGMGNSTIEFNSVSHSIMDWARESLEIAAMCYRDRMTTSYTVVSVSYQSPVEVEPQDCYQPVRVK